MLEYNIITLRSTLIAVTTPQKEIVLKYFKDELSLVAQYEKLMVSKTDKDFRYFVFKDFIFSAAGMVSDIDQDLYKLKLLAPFKVINSLDNSYTEFKVRNKQVMTVYTTEFLQWQDDYVAQKKRYEDLKSEIQMLIVSEKTLSGKLKTLDQHLNILIKKKEEDKLEEVKEKIKKIRSDHVDAIHFLGEKRKELDNLQELLSDFEEEHKKLFVDYFTTVKLAIDKRYNQALDYFGYKFNIKLFRDASKSPEVQKFKLRAHIHGDFSLCKYVEYYVKNVSSDEIADQKRKEYLNAAKLYCKNQREKENLY